jgi:23S rRNA-/tRNA-specific pseudouridylate synthase
VETFRQATLLECEPLTGRTHQIRVHLADAGHPLLFDHQYGSGAPITAKDLGGGFDTRVVLMRTPLHAKSAEFSLAGKKHKVTAPMPGDIAAALELLRAATKRARLT